MYTNADITIYNRYYDKTSRLDKYKRTVINKVFFDESKASNRLQSGLDQADHVLLLIPFDYTSKAKYVAPNEFQGLSNTFTLKIGDRVVKGSITYEIDDKVTDLDKNYEAFTISSVDTKDMGSRHMQHWEVGAK